MSKSKTGLRASRISESNPQKSYVVPVFRLTVAVIFLGLGFYKTSTYLIDFTNDIELVGIAIALESSLNDGTSGFGWETVLNMTLFTYSAFHIPEDWHFVKKSTKPLKWPLAKVFCKTYRYLEDYTEKKANTVRLVNI